MIDIHSHVLYGLDDGAADLADSVAMCRIAAEDGITRLVATPHMHMGYKCATLSDIVRRCDELRAAVDKEGIPLQLDSAAEIFLVENMAERVRSGELPTLDSQGRYVLVEPPFVGDCSDALRLTLRQLNLRDLAAVIAHPERIEAFQRHRRLADELAARGALLQMNASSVTGESGIASTLSRQWIRQGIIHVVASDAHDLDKRPPVLSKAREFCRNLVGEERAAAMFETNPRKILNGEALQPVGPARFA
jgi:protein-tyrosine phosphatase